VVDGMSRLVVVAPHPDDEVLQAGGLLHGAARRGRPIVVVAVTDGEASHARSTCVTPAELREWRATERDDALDRLGVLDAEVVRLAVPDQGCGAAIAELAAALAPVLRRGDVVVTACRADRHPDHVATAQATAIAAAGAVDVVWEAPTWALVHGTSPEPTATLHLDDVTWAAKRSAIDAYRSQLIALGPSPLDGPVVHPRQLARLQRRAETFVAVPT
jgi:LmbE family N-acetylglucosaminyl deacetylase